MAEEKLVFPVPENLKKTAWIDPEEQYNEMYKRSIEDADNFWAELADELPHLVQEVTRSRITTGPMRKIAWFEGGKLNATYNCCLDRWMGTPNENKVAYFVEGDLHPTTPTPSRTVSCTIRSSESPTAWPSSASRRK